MDKAAHKRFCDTLDEHHEWPCEYVFKFIVPQPSLPEIEKILSGMTLSKRESKTGKYVSVSAEHRMECSVDVADIYKKACAVEGVVSL